MVHCTRTVRWGRHFVLRKMCHIEYYAFVVLRGVFGRKRTNFSSYLYTYMKMYIDLIFPRYICRVHTVFKFKQIRINKTFKAECILCKGIINVDWTKFASSTPLGSDKTSALRTKTIGTKLVRWYKN